MAKRKASGSRHRRHLSIPRATFDKLVRHIASEQGGNNMLWSAEAVDALHEEAETFLAEHFQKGNCVCENLNKKTLAPQHLALGAFWSGSEA